MAPRKGIGCKLMAGSKVAVLELMPPREARAGIDAEVLSKSLTLAVNGTDLSSIPAIIADWVA